MTNQDRARLARALAVLGETFNEPISELRAEGYFDALRDLDIVAIEGAIRLALRTKTFFPKPVELRELIEGDRGDQAELGWQELHAEMRRVGSWRVGQLSPLTQATMERMCGTWERACAAIGQATGPELLGWAKRWKEAYGAVSHQEERGALIGRDEAKQLLSGLTEKVRGAQQLPAAGRGHLSLVSPGAEDASDDHGE